MQILVLKYFFDIRVNEWMTDFLSSANNWDLPACVKYYPWSGQAISLKWVFEQACWKYCPSYCTYHYYVHTKTIIEHHTQIYQNHIKICLWASDQNHIKICLWASDLVKSNYRQVSNIRPTIVGNEIVDHSDVVGASPVGAAPTTSSFST